MTARRWNANTSGDHRRFVDGLALLDRRQRGGTVTTVTRQVGVGS